MGAELLVNVRLDWTDPLHYDHDHSLPCRICETVTKQRDGQLVPCHKSCAEGEIARELLGHGRRLIVDERVPSSAEQVSEGLTGHPTPAVAGQRVLLAPEGRR